MKINSNIPALRTLNQLNKANNSSSKTMQRLSSGLRINSASDDAAGLAISQKMTTQVRGLQQANRNAMDGISMIQTAEGAYNEIHAMLQRMRELTVQGANGTYEDKDKESIQKEMAQLQEEIIAVRDRSEFNKKSLLNGSHDKFMLQVGANENQSMKILGVEMNLDDVIAHTYGMKIDPLQKISIGPLPVGTAISFNGETKFVDGTNPIGPIPANTLVNITLPTSAGSTLHNTTTPGTALAQVNAGEKIVIKTGRDAINFLPAATTTSTQISPGGILPDKETAIILPKGNLKNESLLDFSSIEGTDDALARLDMAIETASKIRGKLGAYQNRLEHTVSNLSVSEENITAALSRIMDADMALEMTNFTKYNILSQAATAMLAQANQRPQQILQLLQN